MNDKILYRCIKLMYTREVYTKEVTANYDHGS